MFQKFYSDTLGGRFIKSLLAQTPIPVFDAVVDGDYLVKGCYYVYKRFIINCAVSGILSVSTADNLVPSDNLYPSIFLFPQTGYRAAQFYVIRYIDEYDPKTDFVYKSSSNYYDSNTHYHLGKYLRYIHSTTGLNLLPYYNCYNSTYFSDVELSKVENNSVTINRVSSSKYKVVAIPILFGKSYSIFLDCSSEVLVRACVHDAGGYVLEHELIPHSKEDSQIAQDTLSATGKIYSSLRFQSPVVFRVETDNFNTMMLQKNLYLLIQLPKGNESSIVVLENYDTSPGIYCLSNSVRDVSNIFPKPYLTRLNTKTSFAFSDRLIEYLLGNVIYSQETISRNIEIVQNCLCTIYPDYRRSFLTGQHIKGVWDEDMRRLVVNFLETAETYDNDIFDQDGYINKDIERLIHRKELT